MTETDGQSTPRKRPSGRRTGDSGTRQAILDAARDLFAQYDYTGASLRAIAGQAGVDTGLIRHFFGDKNGLIAATLAEGTTAPDRLAAALGGDPHTVGVRLTETYFALWEAPDTGPTLAAILRSAVTSPKAMDLLRASFGPRLQDRILGAAPDPARAAGVALAVSHLMGIALARYVVKAEPLAAMERAELVGLVAPAVQRYLTGQVG
ncbi:TetR family transcriptional regulator [Streptomyces sp. CA-111067]|uniref:TetR/AcrR family transcriptional regulator n=1 Tax=Streptomyces sp. CA-111067 TaxID=3240046 RepID=UPI003D96DDAF